MISRAADHCFWFGRYVERAESTSRLLAAKRLLGDTDLSITEIAFASGFRSLRRFNAVFVEIYKRSPTEIRKGQRPRG